MGVFVAGTGESVGGRSVYVGTVGVSVLTWTICVAVLGVVGVRSAPQAAVKKQSGTSKANHRFELEE